MLPGDAAPARLRHAGYTFERGSAELPSRTPQGTTADAHRQRCELDSSLLLSYIPDMYRTSIAGSIYFLLHSIRLNYPSP